MKRDKKALIAGVVLGVTASAAIVWRRILQKKRRYGKLFDLHNQDLAKVESLLPDAPAEKLQCTRKEERES